MSGLRNRLPAPLRARLARDRLRRRLAWFGVYDTKVFVVGRNKTGTTTMEAVLRYYGFRVAPQAQGERLSAAARNNPGRSFWTWVSHWEAFQDQPFAATWFLPELLSRYPRARYILTLRDPEQWFASLVTHHYERYGLPHDAPKDAVARGLRDDPYIAPGYRDWGHRRQFGITSDDQLYDRDLYIANYHAHVAAVRAAIPAEKLLEIDLSEHSTTAAICRFLNIPDEMAVPMPRENRRR